MTTQPNPYTTTEDRAAYEQGVDDGYYGTCTRNPLFTGTQLSAYAKGYKQGLTMVALWRSEQEASDNAASSRASSNEKEG